MNAAITPSVTRRWINLWEATPEELAQLDFIFPSERFPLMTTRALVAESAGRIVAAHMLQLFPHPEPQWVDASLRGTGLAQSLATEMNKFLHEMRTPGWMVVASGPHAEAICQAQGMTRVDHPVYVGRSEDSDGISG